jgi:hypothetical protein
MPAVPFPYIPDVIRVVLLARRDGNERITVLHYAVPGGPFDAAQMATFAGQVEGSVGEAIAGCTCVGETFVSVTATDISAPGGIEASVPWSSTATGGLDVLPANVALCLQKRTARSGRSYRGRMFVYDMSEDLFNGSTVNEAGDDQINALMSALFGVQMGGSAIPVVASHTLGTYEPITAISHNGLAGTMSKRLPGRGS